MVSNSESWAPGWEFHGARSAGCPRPGIQVVQPGDLHQLCPVADLAASFAGGFPVLFLHEQEGVSFAFARRFKQQLGVPPHTYQIALRVQLA